MPTYVFADSDGNEHELIMSVAELERRQFKENGERGQFIYDNDRKLKRVYVCCGGQSTVWPIRSAGAGVGVEQVAEQEAYDRKVGLDTKYDRRTGDAIFTSNAHRRRHLKHHGLVDRDSYV